MALTLHFEATAAELTQLQETTARSSGASFLRPEMLCRTGDGHALHTRHWPSVTCERCLNRRRPDLWPAQWKDT